MLNRLGATSAASRPPVDRFGCPATKLDKDQELRSSGIKFFRKGTEESRLGRIATDADDRGFLVGVSRSSGHRRRVFRPSRTTESDFEHGSVYVRDLSEAYRADLYGAFDFVLLEVPRRFLIELAREHGFGSNVDLVCEAGEVNPVLSHLVASIEPLLAEHGKASRLFIDQLSATIGIHLIERYATVDHAGRLARPAHLSRSQFEKAREMLSSDVAGDLSIDEVARACGVSRSYFARGFKQLSGKTPHQWVISQRLAKASDMLIQTDRPLSDIALDCGFADQSHFTRVFSSNNGVPPGVWRRATRG